MTTAAKAMKAAELRQRLGRPQILYVHTRILVHSRRDFPGRPCPCCGSATAEITQTLEDLEVLIDMGSGERVCRPEDPEWFDATKTRAHSVPVILRCSEAQLPLLLDDTHKAIAAFGGNRSGKTTIGLYWMARQWLRRGGKGAKFWLVAPELQHAQTMMQKLILGEFSTHRTPPVFPLGDDDRPLLAKSWPTSALQREQWIEMVDGSVFYLMHAQRDGGKFKGHSVQAILADEFVEVRRRENWTILVMRLTESRGQIFVSSTPKAGHWLREEIVDRSDDGAAEIHHASLSQTQNPWVPLDEVERQIRLIGDERRIAAEVHGQWVTAKGVLWKHFDPMRHVLNGDSYHVRDYIEGATDLTKQVVLKLFPGANPYTRHAMAHGEYVAGQDFNTDYMNLVVAQVFALPNGKTAIFFVDEVVLRDATASKFAHWLGEDRAKKTRMRAYPKVPIRCDATGAYYSVSRVSSDRYTAADAREMAKRGFDCRPCRVNPASGNPQNPPVHDSVSLIQMLLRENRWFAHSRCADLIKGMLGQEDDGRGRPIKVSNTASDRLSGPVDAMRYLAWPVFSSEANAGRPVAIEQRQGGTVLL